LQRIADELFIYTPECTMSLVPYIQPSNVHIL